VQDFDTRMAAVLALDAFYANIHHLSDLSHSLLFPCHMALYDCLNDDDSEIREIAASTYSMWKSQSLMPLAAQQAVSNTLLQDHAFNPLLLWNVVSRMTGSLDVTLNQVCVFDIPEKIFKASLSVDNTLFVEEDQNLYIDEVREIKFWKGIFEQLYLQDIKKVQVGAIGDKALLAFMAWTVDAINSLTTIDQQDGVLGWTSKPAAFSACMRTILCARSLLDFNSRSKLAPTNSSWVEGVRKILAGLDVITAKAPAVGFHESLVAELVENSTENTLR